MLEQAELSTMEWRNRKDVKYPIDKEREIVLAIRSGDYDALERIFISVQREWAPLMQSRSQEMHSILLLLAFSVFREVYRGQELGSDNWEQVNHNIINKLLRKRSPLDCLACIREICYVFARERGQQLEAKHKEIVEQTKRFIEVSVTQNISIEDIARHIHLCSAHLGRIFKNSTGHTLLEYVTEQKVKMASQLLISTEEPVYVIAETIGYTNVKSFSRVFKTNRGTTPSEYRKQYGKQSS